MCLREISTPLAFVNVQSGSCSFLAMNEEQHEEVKVDGGLYVGEVLAHEVDILGEPYNIQCKLHGRRQHRKVRITFSTGTRHCLPCSDWD